MGRTCLDRFNKIIYVTRTMAALCGADCVVDGYKINFVTWIVIIAINAYFACTLYTIYVGVVKNGDWMVILQSLSLAGSAIQGYSKLLFAIFQRLVLISMNKKLVNIYAEYQNDKDYLPVLRYRTDLTTKILKAVMGIYMFVVITILLYPIIYGRLFGKKLLIMQFLLPGVDASTSTGYLVHNVAHAFLVTLGGFGNFAGDMYIFIFISHVPLLKDILKIKCKKLNRTVLRTRDPKETMPLLAEVIKWHQNYNKYAQQVEEGYYGVIFVQVFTSVVSISCTLFSIIIHSWPAAFSYLIYSFSMLYAYCGLGHLVEISNDEVTDILYGDCLWYELTVPQQKLILLMIRKSQKPTELTIGQMMPLSMRTALQLTKAIYSYMMMLLNFLNEEP